MSTHRGVGSSRWLVCLGRGRVFHRSSFFLQLAHFFSLLLSLGLPLALGCTAPNPDYPEPFDCALGARSCKSGTGSTGRPVVQVCGRDISNSLVLIDETCPIGTRCDDGQCAPASGMTSCIRQSDCPADKSCVPLVQGGALAGFCVPSQPAAAAPGATCSDDRSCQSYHCLQQAQGRYCLLTCGSDNHCPLATPRCQALDVTISGVQGMVGSCSPR